MLTAFVVAACARTALPIFVSPKGNDSWPGTQAKPKATIQAAIEASRKIAHPTVLIETGTYELASPIELSAEDVGLAIVADVHGPVTVVGKKGITPDSLIHAVKAMNLTISGLTLEGAGTNGAVVATNCVRFTASHLGISHATGPGIVLTSCRQTTIDHCTVTDTGGSGIQCDGPDANVIDNLVRRVGQTSPNPAAIVCSGPGLTLTHNEASSVFGPGIEISGQGAMVSWNRFFKIPDKAAAIKVSGADGAFIKDNLVRDIKSAVDLEGATGCTVEHNVFYNVPCPLSGHKAVRTAVRANLFDCRGDMLIDFPECQDGRINGNVFVATDSVRFRTPPGGITDLAANMISNWEDPKVTVLTKDGEKPARILSSNSQNLFVEVHDAEIRSGVFVLRPAGIMSKYQLAPWTVTTAGARR